MPRLLVTGGAGFIGTSFVRHRLDDHGDERVVVLDALTYAGNRANLADLAPLPSFRFVRGDIRDTELVEGLLREEELDTVVHFAAESHVDRSITGPDLFVEVNVGGTHSLLKAARAAWLEAGDGRPHRFHHISTDEVYGSLDPEDPPFSETTAYAPNSPYAASKAAGDHLVRAYGETYGLQVTTTNCSNNYGPYQFPEKLIPLCIVNLLTGAELPIYGDGSNVRDWLHVDDHCRGISRVLARGVTGRCYNIGGGSERTNLELVRALCRNLDELFAADPELADLFPEAPPAAGQTCESRIRFVRDRPGHDRRYAIDGRRMQRELDFAPAIALDEGLRSTLRWYVDHATWWRAVMDGSYRQWIDRQYGQS
jgi:dTDP-glucose 4,6-dehydratase